MEMQMLVNAARKSYRFSTVKGPVNFEDLWDMPLTSKNGFNLDEVAKDLNSQLKSASEESFVQPVETDNSEIHEKFAIVKFVIAEKLREMQERKVRAEKQSRAAKLMELISNKQNEELASKSLEELQAELAELMA